MEHPKYGKCPSCGMRKRLTADGEISKHYAYTTNWGGNKIPYRIRYNCYKGGMLPQELMRAVLVIARLK